MTQTASSISTLSAIKSRVLAWLRTFVSEVYYEKEFDSLSESIFERYKKAVDSLIDEKGGDVLEKIPSVTRQVKAMPVKQNKMTNIENLKNAVSSWVLAFPSISRVWLFGSRAKNNCRYDSDIDIAVEIDETTLKNENAFAYWIYEKEKMTTMLQKHISHKIDLQYYDEITAPLVFSYVSEHGISIFDKSNLQSNEETEIK